MKRSSSISRQLIIIGAGGFGSEAAWAAESTGNQMLQGDIEPWQILGYADDDPAKRGTSRQGRPVIGTVAELGERFAGEDVHYFCALGKNDVRARMVERVSAWNWCPVTIVHPSAIIAPGAIIGRGTYVGPGAVVNVATRIGSHVILNMHVSVGHDSVIGDFAQACPGVRVSGGCVIGDRAFLGSNASVAPGVRVGCGATVGANSFAVATVKPAATVMGIPARCIA